MNDTSGTNQALFEENSALKRRVEELERSESDRRLAEEALERRIAILTKPVEDNGGIEFEDMFDLDELQQLQDEFAQATGVASLITRTDGTPITRPSGFYRLCSAVLRQSEGGRRDCRVSDTYLRQHRPEGPVVGLCLGGGLWSAGASITVNGRHIANWLIGQVRNEAHTEEHIRAYARKIGTDEDALVAAFHEVPTMSEERFRRTSQVLFTLANQISRSAYQNVQQARFIVDRKRAAEALQESEERFRELAETLPETLFETDIEGWLTYANRSAFECFGYTTEDFAHGIRVWDMVVPDDLERMRANVRRILSGENIGISEYSLQRKDGSIFPAITHASPIVRDGKPCGLKGFTLDITDRKRSENALRRYQFMVENAKQEIYLAEPDGCLSYVNKAAAESLGYTTEEMRASGVCGFDPIMGPSFHQHFLDLKRGDVPPFETVHIARDGREVVKEVKAFHLAVDGREYVCSFAMDITDRKKAEEALQKLNQELEQRVIERTSQLEATNADLRSTTQQLEKAYTELQTTQSQMLQREKMASIGQLAAGVAHEINNPMGFIISNLGTLNKYIARMSEFIAFQSGYIQDKRTMAELEEKKKQIKLDYTLNDSVQLLEECLEGARRVKNIVQDLRGFSRIDGAEYAEADINAGLESTINVAWNELKYKATVKKEYGDIPRTRCNLGQINQVFLNILVNAAQSIETQGEITARTWHDGAFIHISIADTGCGIPEDKLGKIFDPFFTTKEAGKGTGLGLSIVYDIVKQHEGEIAVKSAVGKGTTFTVRIPVK
jgi:two-component system NtrC family sensor kinase